MPKHQKAIYAVLSIVGGLTALGNILDAVVSAKDLIPLWVAWVGTALAIMGLVVGQFYLKKHGLEWYAGGSVTHIRGLKGGLILPVGGIIVLLWIPSFLPAEQPKTVIVITPTPSTTSEPTKRPSPTPYRTPTPFLPPTPRFTGEPIPFLTVTAVPSPLVGEEAPAEISQVLVSKSDTDYRLEVVIWNAVERDLLLRHVLVRARRLYSTACGGASTTYYVITEQTTITRVDGSKEVEFSGAVRREEHDQYTYPMKGLLTSHFCFTELTFEFDTSFVLPARQYSTVYIVLPQVWDVGEMAEMEPVESFPRQVEPEDPESRQVKLSYDDLMQHPLSDLWAYIWVDSHERPIAFSTE